MHSARLSSAFFYHCKAILLILPFLGPTGIHVRPCFKRYCAACTLPSSLRPDFVNSARQHASIADTDINQTLQRLSAVGRGIFGARILVSLHVVGTETFPARNTIRASAVPSGVNSSIPRVLMVVESVNSSSNGGARAPRPFCALSLSASRSCLLANLRSVPFASTW